MRLDSDRKVLSVSSKPRHKMGEENIMKNTSKNTKSVRSDRKHNGNKNYDGEASDSSEELQYGPGIVNRLKTKYLSMTVREHQNRGARPPLSNLRRANSLENLLAAEKTESNNKSIIMSCAKKFESAKENVATKSNRPSRSEAKPVISRESMKRARSVESLLRTFKDIVIEENTNSCSSQEAVKTSPVKAPNATEYPPPDVVKETLKIFEKCPGQTVVIKAKSPPSKPVISTKPNILSEKSKFNCSNTKPMVSPKPIILTQNYVKNNNEKMKSNINFSYQAQPLVPKARNCMNMPIISSTAHDNSKPKNNVIITSHDCTENKVMQPTESLIMTSENKTDQSKVNKTESPIVENNNAANSNFKLTEIAGKVNLSTLNNKESDIHEVTSKSVSNVALNNIRKSGTSVEFKFPCAKNSSYLPQDRNQVRQIGIIKPIQQPAPQPPVNPVNEPVNKMDTNVVSKSPVNQVFLSIKTENVNLWDSKPWHHTQNTMVFNFCNRKDVPDYIENDGLCLHNRNDARVSFSLYVVVEMIFIIWISHIFCVCGSFSIKKKKKIQVGTFILLL